METQLINIYGKECLPILLMAKDDSWANHFQILHRLKGCLKFSWMFTDSSIGASNM
jgi:hypothetical protein